MKPRNIDHLVVAVGDIDAACLAWQRLGFSVTPTARDPIGTANAIVQLDQTFVELLAVDESASTTEVSTGAFSAADFNRAFLRKHQGISTLVLQSRDPAADRAGFEADGLEVFAPFNFARMATGPDGIARQVGVSMTYVREPRLRDAAFATCLHHYPENFWREEFQHHRNGARRIASAVLVSRDPADFHEFLGKFSGQRDMSSTSLGVTYDLGHSVLEILSPVGYEAFFGGSSTPDPRRFLACRIAVENLPETRRLFDRAGVPHSDLSGALVVPASHASGTAIAFVDDVTFSI